MMVAKAHYTVKPIDRNKNAQGEDDAAEKIRGELGSHYDKTATIRIAKRIGTVWEDCHEIDVFHEDEDDATLTKEARDVATRERSEERVRMVEELAAAVITAGEGEASVEGPTRVRALGFPERGKIHLWGVVWVAGGPFTPGERRVEGADAMATALATTTRSLETAHRILDRAWQRNDQMCKTNAEQAEKLGGTVANIIDAAGKAGQWKVDAMKVELEQQEKKAAHVEKMANDRDNAELVLSALEVIGKALDAERRDREDDRDRRGAPRDGSPIDVDAREPSSSNGNGHAKRPEVPRCVEARDLLGVIERLSAQKQESVRTLLTADEWSALGAACDAPTQDVFDARFGALYDLFQQRGKDGFTELFSRFAGELGFGAVTVQKVTMGWEKRNMRRPD